MTTNCAQQLVASVDRLYMLLDSVYNGRVYVAVDGAPPALPVVPEAEETGITAGLRRQELDAQGILPSGWPFGFGDRPATTADVVARLNVSDGGEIERVQGVLDELNAAADGAAIFNAVRGFFTDGATISVEGLQLGTMLAATMANAALMGLQAQQLDDMRQLLQGIKDLQSP